MNDRPPRGVVGLLTAQALAFGVTLALLLIPANALFLDTYGSEWLPATYIAIAIVGTAASAVVARAARRTRLVRVATASLGILALLFGASWAILVAGGEWTSAVLLVLFPIALQIGFVFVGGQAGRLLDVRQMKELFPRVLTGFAVGFLVGGLLGIPLLWLLGSTTNLLLATTTAQLAFLGLLIVTERRFPEVRAAPVEDAPAVVRPPLRFLFATGLALLLLVYQVLSAMGSQVVDFLLFDRAAARYSGDELTQFLSAYTAVLNVVDILFLALVAGPLLRRFGLRLGLLLNPVVVAVVLLVMTVVTAGAGAASLGLFALAGFLRVADIAATDGTTRTSINAAYQVVPAQDRLAVQAVVEGIGVPVAIGVTGVLLLVLEALDLGTGAVIGFGLVLGVLWTVVATRVYRSYTRALGDEMRRRSFSPADIAAEDEPAIRRLLGSDDPRDVRLGLDLLAGAASPVAHVELALLARHAEPDVRALAQLAADSGDRSALPALLGDSDLAVRGAALDAVTTEDGLDPAVVRLVVAAAEEPRLAAPARRALRRIGPRAAPVLATASALSDPDRTVVLSTLETLSAVGGPELVASDLVDSVVLDAVSLATRAAGASEALTEDDRVLVRALDDEIELARRLVVAALTLRYGPEVQEAIRVVDRSEGQRRALGVEAVDVLLTRGEAALVLPLVVRDVRSEPGERRRDDWLADLADDPDAVWRSSWLSMCARHLLAAASGSDAPSRTGDAGPPTPS